MIHKDFFSIISLPLTGIPNMQRKCKNSEYYPNNDKPLCYLPKCFHISTSFYFAVFLTRAARKPRKYPYSNRLGTA